jgi:hypothetical protein
MIEQPYSVYIVVDRNFGERLASLPIGVPVWIVDTPANTAVAQRLWKERPRENLLTGITIFKVSTADSPEKILIGELATIHLHHGMYSRKPPYTRVLVMGAPLSEKIKLAFADYGFDEFSSTPERFQADRKTTTTEAGN